MTACVFRGVLLRWLPWCIAGKWTFRQQNLHECIIVKIPSFASHTHRLTSLIVPITGRGPEGIGGGAGSPRDDTSLKTENVSPIPPLNGPSLLLTLMPLLLLMPPPPPPTPPSLPPSPSPSLLSPPRENPPTDASVPNVSRWCDLDSRGTLLLLVYSRGDGVSPRREKEREAEGLSSDMPQLLPSPPAPSSWKSGQLRSRRCCCGGCHLIEARPSIVATSRERLRVLSAPPRLPSRGAIPTTTSPLA